MSVVINTNSSATIAASNLSESNRMLQKSLNRLSSGSRIVNAADDAGGVAVAARLSAASQRTSGALGNITSALSFLQQQDSALKTGSKLMQRMNELQILYRDTTKNASDKAQYTTEFDKLKSQYYSAVRNSQFNGLDMMKAGGALSITINEGLDTYSLANLSSNINDSRTWAITDGGNFASFSGSAAFSTLDTGAGNLIITVGSAAAVTIALAGTDKMGDVVSRINASTAAVTASITDDGYLKLTGKNQGEAITLSDSTSGATLAALGVSAGPHNATGQTDHSLLEIDSIATARAKNGADQNVLQYYSELATASKTNFESAVSRIMDVDVAQESTQLARWNTLVQAGTAMMAQANGSTLSALSLLKG
jgi:flagellin